MGQPTGSTRTLSVFADSGWARLKTRQELGCEPRSGGPYFAPKSRGLPGGRGRLDFPVAEVRSMDLLTWLTIASAILSAVSLVFTGYLGVLALLSGHRKPPQVQHRDTRFAVVVPAHNEQEDIGATVENLLAVDWPTERYEVVVVADNCNDATAERAKQAGARVFERHHDELRGKGYALEFAFDTLLQEEIDAIVVVDADTKVSPNLLEAFAARLQAGEHAAQAEYAVENVHASWRTKLMAVALAMFHGVRSLGRERVKVSAGLRGNGMCFSVALLKEHPHKSYGLVEDIEYGVTIGLGGYRVAYVGEATVRGEMVTGGKAAASQRRRWEGGRVALAKERVPALLGQAFRGPSLLCLDLAMDLIVPPLSYVGILLGLGVLLEGGLFLAGGFVPAWSLAPWLLSQFLLGLYVVRGVWLSGLGFQGFVVLAWAPVFIVWKILVVRPWKGDKEWVRTERESERKPNEEERDLS